MIHYLWFQEMWNKDMTRIMIIHMVYALLWSEQFDTSALRINAEIEHNFR